MQQSLHSVESRSYSKYIMDPLKQYTFCRLCLCTSASLTDIFDVGSNSGYQVKKTIEDLLQYKVIRINGCPWLVCGNCREKLNEFRRFKISCIESKMAFENRFPQQVILMAGSLGIPTSTFPSQEPPTLLLVPIAHPPTEINNINTFQLPPPSLCEAQMPDANHFFVNGIVPNDNKQNVEVVEPPETEAHKAMEILLLPKLEPAEIQPTGQPMDVVDNQVRKPLDSIQLNTEAFEIEEPDVKSEESCNESSNGIEGESTLENNAGEIKSHSGRLINHKNANLRKKTESIDMGKLPLPFTANEESLVVVSEDKDLVPVLCGEQRSCEGSCPHIASSADSVSCGEVTSVSATHQPGKVSVQPTVQGGVVSGEASSLGKSISDCLPKTTNNSKVIVNPECNVKNSQPMGGSGVNPQVICIGDTFHLNPFKCTICLQKFVKPDHLASHKLSHEGDPKPYKCPMCPRRYKSRRNQTRHWKSHYSVPQRFQCEVCKADFRFYHCLKRHIKAHAVKDSFPCKICGQVFKSRQVQGLHMVKHSGPKFPCPNCDKVFFHQHKLSDHLLMHNNEKSFLCHICGKSFNKPQYLRCHRQLHDEVKRYSCKECSAKFSQYAALWQHRKWHEGNKKYVCNVCNKGFVLNCQLRQHQKIHTNASSRKGGKVKARKLDRADGNAKATEADGNAEELDECQERHTKMSTRRGGKAKVKPFDEADGNVEATSVEEHDGQEGTL